MAPPPPSHFPPQHSDRVASLSVPDTPFDTDSSDIDGTKPALPREQNASQADPPAAPVLFHKVQNQRSILSLLVNDGQIFAGTQGGEIIVCSFSPRPKTFLNARLGLVVENVRAACAYCCSPWRGTWAVHICGWQAAVLLCWRCHRECMLLLAEQARAAKTDHLGLVLEKTQQNILDLFNC